MASWYVLILLSSSTNFLAFLLVVISLFHLGLSTDPRELIGEVLGFRSNRLWDSLSLIVVGWFLLHLGALLRCTLRFASLFLLAFLFSFCWLGVYVLSLFWGLFCLFLVALIVLLICILLVIALLVLILCRLRLILLEARITKLHLSPCLPLIF